MSQAKLSLNSRQVKTKCLGSPMAVPHFESEAPYSKMASRESEQPQSNPTPASPVANTDKTLQTPHRPRCT